MAISLFHSTTHTELELRIVCFVATKSTCKSCELLGEHQLRCNRKPNGNASPTMDSELS
jgi:hypothetical protein